MAKLVPKGQPTGSMIELTKDPLTIGRRAENRLVITDQAASGKHATITMEKDQFFIEDLKSSNGTYVNGAPVSGRQPLKHGDVVMIGRLAFEFQDGSDLLGTLVMMAPVKPQRGPTGPDGTEDNLPRFILPPGPMPAAGATPPTRPVQGMPLPAAPAIPSPAPPVPPSIFTAPPPAPAAPADHKTREFSATDVNMLDQLVGSIRSHREREAAERAQKAAQTKIEWDKTLSYGEQMKVKVAGDPRIKYFGVSRSTNEIMIRYQRDPKAPIIFVMLALYHPDQAEKDRVITGIWMRRTGEQDRCLQSAADAAGELVRELAFLLA